MMLRCNGTRRVWRVSWQCLLSNLRLCKIMPTVLQELTYPFVDITECIRVEWVSSWAIKNNLTLRDNMTRQVAMAAADILGSQFQSWRRCNVHEKVKKNEKVIDELKWKSQVREHQVLEQVHTWEEDAYQILLCRHHICNLFCWIRCHLRPGNWEHQGRWWTRDKLWVFLTHPLTSQPVTSKPIWILELSD